jgi:hypothetical protein
MPKRAKEPFVFYSILHLVELTGHSAATLQELAALLRSIDGSSIYFHTHQFVKQHLYLTPEPPNDFAYWVAEVLGEDRLGETLSAVDVTDYSSLGAMREALVSSVEGALALRPRLKHLSAPEGEEFHFLKSVSFVFATDFRAHDLAEFADCLRRASLDSIYFHLFEARLRLERPTNDFSNWVANALDEEALAVRIARLDPYSQSGEGIRKELLKIVDGRFVREA